MQNVNRVVLLDPIYLGFWQPPKIFLTYSRSKIICDSIQTCDFSLSSSQSSGSFLSESIQSIHDKSPCLRFHLHALLSMKEQSSLKGEIKFTHVLCEYLCKIKLSMGRYKSLLKRLTPRSIEALKHLLEFSVTLVVFPSEMVQKLSPQLKMPLQALLPRSVNKNSSPP